MPVSLKNLTTFGIEATCAELYEVHSPEQIPSYHGILSEPHLILGGGSNILITKNLEIPVIAIRNQGIHIEQENQSNIWVKVGAGVVWDELVHWAVSNGFGGVENLSLIPGHVGAAPVQNIGAYGVEIANALKSVTAWDKFIQNFCQISVQDCQLGYRDSYFKQKGKDRFIITEITLCLQKPPTYNPILSYGTVLEELRKSYLEPFTIQQVRDTIVEIRRTKLPDPKVTGNAGSFFRNPIISHEQFVELQKDFPAIVHYRVHNEVKLAAGWLIEQVGWKGYRQGDVGCHPKQALVLVNYGKATGAEVWELAQKIQQSIFQKFNVKLEPEVNVY